MGERRSSEQGRDGGLAGTIG